jgi:uncharacterized membrane protein
VPRKLLSLISISNNMFFDKKLLSKEEEARLIKAIELAEKQTSGEIRVHIEKDSKEEAVSACVAKFHELNMQNTKQRNAILFYLAYKSKSFAVWGDEGIHEIVKDEFWKNITDRAIEHFKQGDYIAGLEKSIELCGEQLKQHFPLQHDDTDELPNQISY